MIARQLPGLPPYGKVARNFPKADAFSEGLVVEFIPKHGESWVGNFATGGRSVEGVHDNLGENAVLVVSGGNAYLVDTTEQRVILELWGVTHLRFESDLDLFVIADDCQVSGVGRSGIKWRSRRVSWDGITDLRREGLVLTGLAHYPQDLPPVPFAIDLMSGEASGGSY